MFLFVFFLQGETVMSDELEEAYNAILNQRVPVKWRVSRNTLCHCQLLVFTRNACNSVTYMYMFLRQNASYESTKPLGAWTLDLCERVAFFNEWSRSVVAACYRAVKPKMLGPKPSPAAAQVQAASAEAVPAPMTSLTSVSSAASVTSGEGEAGGESKSTSGPKMESIEERDEETTETTTDAKQKPPNTPPTMTTTTTTTTTAAATAVVEPAASYVHPRSFWLSAFFFPQGFLTAVMQMHARKLGVSVDSLEFHFNILRSNLSEDWLTDLKQRLDVRRLAFEGEVPPKDGVLVFGLFLDGARWDAEKHALGNSLPGQRFSRLPEMHFQPVQTVRHWSV